MGNWGEIDRLVAGIIVAQPGVWLSHQRFQVSLLKKSPDLPPLLLTSPDRFYLNRLSFMS